MTAVAVEEPGAPDVGTPVPEAVDPEAGAGGGGPDVGWMVRSAAAGDLQAWNRLVDQYARLIWSITAKFKLAEGDAADVVQTTWMRLIEHINRIEHPERVGSWLATTARNECLRHVGARKRIVLVREDGEFDGADHHGPAVDEALLASERAADVREAMAHLPPQWQRLMGYLMADPPMSYAEISDQLGLAIGSIGPTRRRCLARLRVLLGASLPLPGHSAGGLIPDVLLGRYHGGQDAG